MSPLTYSSAGTGSVLRKTTRRLRERVETNRAGKFVNKGIVLWIEDRADPVSGEHGRIEELRQVEGDREKKGLVAEALSAAL